jgi:hypothetical protein
MLSPFQWNREHYNEYRLAGRTVLFTSAFALCAIAVGAGLVIYDKDHDGDPATGDLAFFGSALVVIALTMIAWVASEKKALSSSQTRAEEDEDEE